MDPRVDPEAWTRVKALFHDALEQPPADRLAWLAGQEGAPPVLEAVKRLLRADREVGDRFDRAAVLHVPADGPVDLPAASLTGQRIGKYEVVRRIGEGGMGTVYEAVRADEYRERVAIKTVWRGVDSTLLAQRLRTERQILASLRHSNIAVLLDGGTTPEGLPYLVMEYVEGQALDTWCDAQQLDLVARLDLFQQVCAAVAHAHRNLVVHRDLKPSNVLVTPDGVVKLLDFGVAKLLDGGAGPGTLTGAGISPFTAAFAAPEQVGGDAVTTATDVYALGALLHVLLTGCTPLPVDGRSPAELVLAVRQGIRAVPSAAVITTETAAARGGLTPLRLRRLLTGELDAIVQQALRIDPALRYATVDALCDDVRRYLRGDRVLARPDSVGYRLRTMTRRRPALVTAIAAVCVTLVGGAAATWWSARQIRLEAARADAVAQFLGDVIGTTGGSGEAITRLGPQTPMAEVVDSAARLVPTRFASDGRVRARLYTALGASYYAQGRLERAAALLDSARTLARAMYGPQSEPYVAATLQAAFVTADRQTPTATRALADDALAHVSALPHPERFTALALELKALADVFAGNLRRADSLMTAARALEPTSTRPTRLQVEHLTLQAQLALLAEEHPRGVILATQAVDAATAFAGERAVDFYMPAWTLAMATAAARDTARMQRVVARLERSARQAFGIDSREYAMAMHAEATLRTLQGDREGALRVADSAWTIVSAPSRANAVFAADIARVVGVLSGVLGRQAHGDSVVSDALQRARRLETPYAIADLSAILAAIRVNQGRLAEAESLARAALAALEPAPDLAALMDGGPRGLLVQILRRRGRMDEAEQERRRLPPAIAAALALPPPGGPPAAGAGRAGPP